MHHEIHLSVRIFPSPPSILFKIMHTVVINLKKEKKEKKEMVESVVPKFMSLIFLPDTCFTF